MQSPSFQERWSSLLSWCKQMRDTQPVYYDKQSHFWNIFRYEDVVRVLSDPATFSSDTTELMPQQNFLGKGDLTQMDPPRHRQLRGLVSQAFTPRVIERMAPRIAEITNQLLDEVAPRGKMDILPDLAAPLPIIVIAELLGIPAEDRGRFKRWTDTLLETAGNIDQLNEATLQLVTPTMQEMYAYLQNYCQERREYPREDLISRLITAQIEGQTLDDEEILGFIALLLLAGNVTTTILIGNAILCLDEHPDAMMTLRQDPSLLPVAIEEILRYRSPFTATVRVTTTDVTLHGVTIPAKQMVFTWLISANYDERQFPDPECFDIRREPNRHQAFGHGIHFCIGAPLARLEARIALNILLERFPGLRRVPGGELEPHESSFVTGVKNLPVTW